MAASRRRCRSPGEITGRVRLRFDHKVRAAEAMAQRMLLIAERDRGKRLGLDEIFLSVADDTMVRILAEEVTHPRLMTKSPPAARLARALLDRQLLHRAYAFRSRFVSMPPGISEEVAEATRNEQWRRLLKSLDTLAERYELGVAIHALAKQAAEALLAAGVDERTMSKYAATLDETGPEQIIVDLPKRKAAAIRIMARYPDGTLKVPEFSFNPVKWADAYDLQKRTGYVFCPYDIVPIVALASTILFMTRYGVVMGPDAQGYIKAGPAIDQAWVRTLLDAGIIDQEAADQLQSKGYSLLSVQTRDLHVPSKWIEEKTQFAVELIAGIKRGLRSGLTAETLTAFSKVMEAMFAFMDLWYAGNRVSGEVSDEADLQQRLCDHLRSRSLKVEEGTVANGGKLDLFVENAVLIENKFKGTATIDPNTAAPTGPARPHGTSWTVDAPDRGQCS
jgi:hypothetical protein